MILTYSVGLEEGVDGTALVHAFSVPGCVAMGATRDEALSAFPRELSAWLRFLGSRGASVPAPNAELDVAVDEWVTSDRNLLAGESDACFEHDLLPLSDEEVASALAILGDLRRALLDGVHAAGKARLDDAPPDSWTPRRILDELARAQWWTLTRLGASPLAEVPPDTIGRLDTAMALVVRHFGELPERAYGLDLDLDGERWTPRKVLRRLLWLEWSLGRSALRSLNAAPPPS